MPTLTGLSRFLTCMQSRSFCVPLLSSLLVCIIDFVEAVNETDDVAGEIIAVIINTSFLVKGTAGL